MNVEPVEPFVVESRFHSFPYVLVGGLYGFLIGLALVGSGATIDKLLYRDLPLGIDWSLLTVRGEWIVAGLALIGAAAALFKDALPSLFAGAVIAGLVALVSALAFSPAAMGVKALVVIFGLVPMAVLSLPVTLLLRWLVDKHEQALEAKRFPRIISLFVLAVIVGAVCGYFLKMPGRALLATRFMHQVLQEAPREKQSPVWNLPGFQEHSRMSYRLFQKTSASSTEGFDLRAEYEDGYTVKCTVVIYPGSDPYMDQCTSFQKQASPG